MRIFHTCIPTNCMNVSQYTDRYITPNLYYSINSHDISRVFRKGLTYSNSVKTPHRIVCMNSNAATRYYSLRSQ